MKINEREIEPTATRTIEVAIDSPHDVAAWLDRPAVLVVWLAGIRTEMAYKHGSTASAAARRIALAHRLVKLPGRARWRSRPR